MGKKGRVLPFAMPTARDQAEPAVSALPAAADQVPLPESPAADGHANRPAAISSLPRRIPGEGRPMPGKPGPRNPEPGSPSAGSPGPAGGAPGNPVPRQPGPAGPRPPAVTPATPSDPDPDRIIERDAGRPGPGARPEPAAPEAGAGGARPEPAARESGPGTARPEPPARESGLLVPRPQAEVGRRPAAPAAPHPGPGAPPSWAKVTTTTLQLFLARRRTPWRVIAALVAALVVFAGGALTVALIRGPGPGPARAGHARTAPGTPGLAQVQAATAVRQQAAAWVAAQVSHSAVVACDPAMCASLQSEGFPAGNLMSIGPASSDPLGSTVIVATAAVRNQFGSRLESVFAPTVMASFGTGTAQVDVRVYAAGGAGTYLAALKADQATRQDLGRVLLRNPRVSATPGARAQLLAGLVDTRLLATIVTLTGQGKVSIVGFSDSGPGAGPGVPLRVAELASPPGAKSGYLPAALALLRAQQEPYLAAGLGLARVDGQEILRIEFAAPSPLGLLSG